MNKRVFSGIQPSGSLHLGNYLGAVKNWVGLQDKHESIFCVVDLHAITVPQKPEELRKKVLEVAKIYLAAGIDPKKTTIFVQSHVPEHTELAWLLNTITKTGELSRMTQFKDKSGVVDFDKIFPLLNDSLNSYAAVENGLKDKSITSEECCNKLSEAFKKLRRYSSSLSLDYIESKKIESISAGLFNYPILMAADILLYDTNLVPVGKDQKQHIELTKELARRFNKRFGKTFTVPEAFTTEESENIMGLDDPTKKMSKSASSENNYIALMDDADTIREKIKRAVTDSGKEIKYSDEKPAIKNLINIYSLLDNVKPKEVEDIYRGKGYAEFKKDLMEVIISSLEPFQERYREIDDREVARILEIGAQKAKKLAAEKIQEVKEKMGLL